MSALFYAIYDDTARPIPLKIYHFNPITIYRTANMALVEELSGKGFEPTAMLLEEDIAELRAGNYANEEISDSEMEFLKNTVNSWAMKEE